MPPFELDGEPASLLYLINLTAGLLDGDGHLIQLVARAGTRAVVTGQSATRVHPALGSFATQQWAVEVEDDACLVVLPGPTIPYRGCRYYQRGRVELAPRARLIWGDIWLAGRYERGDLSERFQFGRIVQDFEARRAGRLVYRDRFRWDGPWSPADADVRRRGPGRRQPLRGRAVARGTPRGEPGLPALGLPARQRRGLPAMVRRSGGRHGRSRPSRSAPGRELDPRARRPALAARLERPRAESLVLDAAGKRPDERGRRSVMEGRTMGLLGILLALALLMWLAFRGWSVLLVAPAAAMLAAVMSGEPPLAHWTQTFMGGASRFVARWLPLFLLGGLFGKLMDDSGSITSIARFLTERLGTRRTMLAVVLASAVVTYGGVSVFVCFFVLVPMADHMFRAANIPRRLMPATIGLGAFTFTMSALPGSPSVNNAVPMPYFGTTPFAAPGLGIISSIITMVFGMWWLGRAEAAARRAGEGYGGGPDAAPLVDEMVREHATSAGEFDPAEINHGKRSDTEPPVLLAALPLVIVMAANFLLALVVLPRLDFSYLAEERWGGITRGSVAGVWAVALALAAGSLTVVVVNYRRLPALRESIDAGANSSVLPVLTVGSVVGFGAVVAAMPAFAGVRDAVLSIRGGPLISLTVAMNLLAGLTGSASGGMTIVLDALGDTYLRLAIEHGIDPALMHRVSTISAGTLDALPHNGTVLTVLQVSRLRHRESYLDMVMTVVVSTVLGTVAVIILGLVFGSF
jgi:H+/gluconate symporter-like permease